MRVLTRLRTGVFPALLGTTWTQKIIFECYKRNFLENFFLIKYALTQAQVILYKYFTKINPKNKSFTVLFKWQ